MDFSHLLYDSDIRLYDKDNWWQNVRNAREASGCIVRAVKLPKETVDRPRSPLTVVFVIDHELSVVIRNTVARVSLGFRKGVTSCSLEGHHDIEPFKRPVIRILGTMEGTCVVRQYPPYTTDRKNVAGIFITLPESLIVDEARTEELIRQWLKRCGYVLGDILRLYGPPPVASA
ncbi:MAG: hypothetical protein HYV65_01525 [Candidatus Spechtbacteria bacterium]|nr:hypothetical protein [Candidatus Spechtbacteria bacterium]